jgi:putative FmdB family regulatory protein
MFPTLRQIVGCAESACIDARHHRPRSSILEAMPLYEYECTACHRRLEKIQKFSDAELTECPHCGGKLERTITAPSFQFTGGGWYKDLYSSTPAGGGDTKSETKSDAKTGTSESTPAAPASAPAAVAPSAPAAPAPSPSSNTSKT